MFYTIFFKNVFINICFIPSFSKIFLYNYLEIDLPITFPHQFHSLPYNQTTTKGLKKLIVGSCLTL